jgi:hypothetical protein
MQKFSEVVEHNGGWAFKWGSFSLTFPTHAAALAAAEREIKGSYQVVEHKGAWAYKSDVFSNTFPTHAEALAAAEQFEIDSNIYKVVELDGVWAYTCYNAVMMTFPTRAAALARVEQREIEDRESSDSTDWHVSWQVADDPHYQLDDSARAQLRLLLYPIQFEARPVLGIDRVLKMIFGADAYQSPFECLDAIKRGLGSDEKLSAILPCRHNEDATRNYLRMLSNAIARNCP